MTRGKNVGTAIWRISKAGIPIAAGLVALILVIAWLAGTFQAKIPPGRDAQTVARLAGQPTDVVHEIQKASIEEAIGTLRAASRTVISAKLLATIAEITVSAGDQVQAGDLLVRLENSEFDARLNQAQQSLAGAQATREEADLALARAKALLASRAVSQAGVDRAKAAAEIAHAEELKARQAVREAEILLSYATIEAPKPGRVVDRLAEPGDTSRPGEPLLVLYDETSLRLEAPVLEHLAVKLKPGDQLNVYVDALQREIPATIDEIVPQADAPSRSFLVKASLPKSVDLYEGMFGRLRIPGGERRHLCLATDAIRHVGQLEFVEVVLSDGTLQRRFIKTGRLGMPGRVEVLSGVKAGEQVVLNQP